VLDDAAPTGLVHEAVLLLEDRQLFRSGRWAAILRAVSSRARGRGGGHRLRRSPGPVAAPGCHSAPRWRGAVEVIPSRGLSSPRPERRGALLGASPGAPGHGLNGSG